MIILKPYQTEAVEQLTKSALKQLALPGRRQKLVFKAPTGSGKTVTMAALLDRLCAERPDLAFVWLAPNQLHLQSFRALRAYFAELRSLRPMYFEDVTDGRLAACEVLFLNWQSVSGKHNVYVRENEQGRTLQHYLEATRDAGVELIAILDEAHLFASKGDKAKELLTEMNVKIEIDVSATPHYHSDYQYVIPRGDVVAAEMIKQGITLNPAIRAEDQAEKNLNQYLLEEAMKKRAQLAAAYRAQGSAVNPLLLVQLPNDAQKESKLDKEIKEEVLGWLDYHIQTPMSVQNGRLAIWLSAEKENLEEIERADSAVDVLLFKQAIALGWDCPRAAVLLIYRELKQETFTIQTVGRILRMPEQKHYADPLLNYGYVYTNLSRNQIQVVAADQDYFMSQKAVRIAEYQSLALPARSVNTQIMRNRLGARFRSDCFYPAAAQYFELKDPRELVDAESAPAFNVAQLQRKFIQTDVKQIEIPIPRDLTLTGEVEGLTAAAVERFAHTYGELSRMLDHFCYDNVGGYAKRDSFETLKGALLRFFQDYLQIDEFTAVKIILAPNNRLQWLAVIDDALKRHDVLLQAAVKHKEVVKYPWDVPPERAYNHLYTPKSGTAHALVDFHELKKASGPEQRFFALLEAHKAHLQWWYKNGEKNKEDFAIVYEDGAGVLRSFYVDFVICLKNGVICLFDTKTLNADPEFCNKHNALLAYIAELNAGPAGRYLGGVIVPVGKEDNETWKYSLSPITSAQDATGWTIFNPAVLAETKP